MRAVPLFSPRSSSVIKSSSNAKPESSSKDLNPNSSSVSQANDKDGTPEGNSDAETIVLPGKDGHSPSKVRKIIKREDKSDGEEVSSSLGRKHSNSRQDREGERGDRGEAKDRRAGLLQAHKSRASGEFGCRSNAELVVVDVHRVVSDYGDDDVLDWCAEAGDIED